jgi:hypothetical protein
MAVPYTGAAIWLGRHWDRKAWMRLKAGTIYAFSSSPQLSCEPLVQFTSELLEVEDRGHHSLRLTFANGVSVDFEPLRCGTMISFDKPLAQENSKGY